VEGRRPFGEGPVRFGVPFVTLCAMLERRGYRREGIRELDRRYVADVLLHPTEPGGALFVSPPEDAPESEEEFLRRHYARLGYPEHRVETLVKEALADADPPW
jgi:hypothetical protein